MLSVVEGQAECGGPGLPARATPRSLRLPCILDEACGFSSLNNSYLVCCICLARLWALGIQIHRVGYFSSRTSNTEPRMAKLMLPMGCLCPSVMSPAQFHGAGVLSCGIQVGTPHAMRFEALPLASCRAGNSAALCASASHSENRRYSA